MCVVCAWRNRCSLIVAVCCRSDERRLLISFAVGFGAFAVAASVATSDGEASQSITRHARRTARNAPSRGLELSFVAERMSQSGIATGMFARVQVMRHGTRMCAHARSYMRAIVRVHVHAVHFRMHANVLISANSYTDVISASRYSKD